MTSCMTSIERYGETEEGKEMRSKQEAKLKTK